MFGRPATDHICGLYFNNGPKRCYLPQVALESHTAINPVCSTTKLTQTFENVNDATLSQVRYAFPLYDGVTVNGYSISYADKILRGRVEQKDQAKKTYQAAVDRGETAGLLEPLPSGIFGVTLGNVPAKASIVVDITYCGELKHDAAIDGLRYTLPTSIAPRYGNYPGEVLKSNTVSKGGMKITVDVDMASSAIRKVQSPSHPIAVSMGALSTAEDDRAPFVPSRASATLAKGSTELVEDFILQVLVDDISRPQALIENHPSIPNNRALMTTLVPKFSLPSTNPEIVFIADQSGSMSGSKNAALVKALRVFLKSLPFGVRFNICAFGNDFKFLFPKSQAYSEDKLDTAIKFVDSFTANYGGTEILKPITAAFEQKLKDLPLEVMLLTDGEIWSEQGVFSYINEQIAEKKVNARVFALGIGRDVSHTLVEGVARAGNGFAQFVTQDEETDQKVMRMLKGALFAHTQDYELEVHYQNEKDEEKTSDDDFEIVEKVNECLKIAEPPPPAYSPKEKEKGGKVVQKIKTFFDPSADLDKSDVSADRYAHLPAVETPKLLQAPNTIPPLYPFNRTTLYLILGPETPQKKVASLTLRATSAHGPLELNVPVFPTSSDGGDEASTIHQLAARKATQELEEGRGWLHAATVSGTNEAVRTKYESRFDELIERECVRLGTKFQVAGKFTSFVAVEAGGDRKEEEKGSGVNENLPASDGTRSGRTDVRMRLGRGMPRMQFASMAARRYFEPPSPPHLVFGGGAVTAAAVTTTTAGGFGSTAGRGGGLFDKVPATSQNSGASPPGAASSIASQYDSLFGAKPAATESDNSSLFGLSASAFGSIRQQSSGSLFGASSAATNTSGGLFGNAPQQGSSSLFAMRTCGGPNLFGSGVPPASASSTSNLLSTTTSHNSQGTSSLTPPSSSVPAPPPPLPAAPPPPPAASSYSLSSPTASVGYSPVSSEDEDMGFALTDSPPPSGGARFLKDSTPASGDNDVALATKASLATYEKEMSDAAAMPLDDQDLDVELDTMAEKDGPDLRQAAVTSTYDPTIEDTSPAVPLPAAKKRKGSAAMAVGGGRDRERSSPPTTTAADDVKKMSTLIDLQTFSGAWGWNSQFLSLLGVTSESVKARLAGVEEETVLASALAVAFLEKRVAAKKEVWEMVVAKARAYLEQALGDEAKVGSLVERAASLF